MLIDNINQYEHGYGLVNKGDIIPHGRYNNWYAWYANIVLNLFWHHINMNLSEDELSIHFLLQGGKSINDIGNRKYS